MQSFFFHVAFDLDPAASPRLIHDWRYDKLSFQNFNMTSTAALNNYAHKRELAEHVSNGISVGPGGLATKGRYEPCDPHHEDIGWGVVRLYRDAQETPGLYDKPTTPKNSKTGRGLSKKDKENIPPFQDEDCTTLCILAVPSYLTPSDFLGFVGEKTRDEVSHFRMIKTERGNRYMVLMKFRNGKKAREWRREWNGKAFDGLEPENCHVVFVKTIEFRSPSTPGQESSFPDLTNDPFTPSITKPLPSTSSSITPQPSTLPSSSSRSSKPPAPPTPALIELPTCPVCLERMDESTGLLTILCQHVFHCTCLQKWRGTGCPVCRFTQDEHGKRAPSQSNSLGDTGLNECSTCHLEADLWICLICGNVACGRYNGAHAFGHWQESSHCFAMDMTSQRIWDYSSDGYVHQIVQDKTDGKFVGTSTANSNDNNNNNNRDDDFDDYVPREKLDNIVREYTHLLTSQLESQRIYFEEALERAADKASQASRSAEKAIQASSRTSEQLSALQISHDTTIPALEKDRNRAVRKGEKFEQMARKLEKDWREEKAMGENLRERMTWKDDELKGLKKEAEELREMNRDLTFAVTGQRTLGGMGEDVQLGTVVVPDAAEGGKGKKKGGKKKKGWKGGVGGEGSKGGGNVDGDGKGEGSGGNEVEKGTLHSANS